MAVAPTYDSGSKSDRLVVKSTFLDLDDGHQHRHLFRSLSDSSLCKPSSLPEYHPGSSRPSPPSLRSGPSSQNLSDDLSESSGADKCILVAPRGDRFGHPSGNGPSDEGREQLRTTVMLRNLPNNYTRAMLLNMLDKHGLAGTYDFVYLPMDFDRRCSLGYAFVNLVDAALMPRFEAAFDGFTRWRSHKVCRVVWSERDQGVRANVKRYRNSSVMHPEVPDEFKPCLFSEGRRVPFPPPRKQIARPVTHPGRRP